MTKVSDVNQIGPDLIDGVVPADGPSALPVPLQFGKDSMMARQPYAAQEERPQTAHQHLGNLVISDAKEHTAFWCRTASEAGKGRMAGG